MKHVFSQRSRSADEAELRAVADRFSNQIEDWGLCDEDVAKLLLLPSCVVAGTGGARFVRLDGDAERRMRRLLALEAAASSLLAPYDRFAAWLHTPNAGLCQSTPIDCLRASPDALAIMLSMLLDEHRAVFGADSGW